MRTVALLILSNCFMTTAWYWHLRGDARARPLIVFILFSWLLALPEYALAVPANRLGHVLHGGSFTAPQLKILQEGIALGVFLIFTLVVLREIPTWRDHLGMALILLGLAVSLSGRTPVTPKISALAAVPAIEAAAVQGGAPPVAVEGSARCSDE